MDAASHQRKCSIVKEEGSLKTKEPLCMVMVGTDNILQTNNKHLPSNTHLVQTYSKYLPKNTPRRNKNVTFRPYKDIASYQLPISSLKMTVDNLYPEILCMIFSHLNVLGKGRVAQVSSKWRDAAYSKSVWKGCRAKFHLRQSNPALFSSLFARGITRVDVLSLHGDKSLQQVCALPNLETLNLSGCYNLTDSRLDTALDRSIPSLTNLNLSLCKNVSDNSLRVIATYCKNIQVLDLGGCTKITNTGLLLISWGLNNMKSINLRSCWQISDSGICHLAGMDLPDKPNIKTIQLRDLNLQDCQKITDQSLCYIADQIPSIQRLNLSFCASITDTGMKSLARLSAMEYLNLRSCDNISDIGLGYLAEGSIRLKTLDVSFCERVTDASMAHIATGLFNLRSLSMAAAKINDEGICKISKTLLDLNTLNIGQCTHLSDKCLEDIAKTMNNLISIDLYGCTNITQDGINLLIQKQKLKSINLGLWHAFQQ